jgi:hypothetical protein
VAIQPRAASSVQENIGLGSGQPPPVPGFHVDSFPETIVTCPLGYQSQGAGAGEAGRRRPPLRASGAGRAMSSLSRGSWQPPRLLSAPRESGQSSVDALSLEAAESVAASELLSDLPFFSCIFRYAGAQRFGSGLVLSPLGGSATRLCMPSLENGALAKVCGPALFREIGAYRERRSAGPPARIINLTSIYVKTAHRCRCEVVGPSGAGRVRGE